MSERLAALLSRLVATAVRFPGHIVERWFGVYLAGWGLLCALEPRMFETMPRAFEDLRGATGAYHEWHYAVLFIALGVVQLVAAKRGDAGRLGWRAVVATVAVAVLAGLASAFVIDGTVTSGTYTYGFLAASEAAVAARLLLIRWGRRQGVAVEARYFAVATPIRS